MTPRTFYVYTPQVAGRYVLLRGVGAAHWLRAQKIPAVRTATRRGFDVRAERLPDLLARAEAAGIRVVLGQENAR